MAGIPVEDAAAPVQASANGTTLKTMLRVIVIVIGLDCVVSQDGGEYDFIVVGAGSAGSRALSLHGTWMLAGPYWDCMRNTEA